MTTSELSDHEPLYTVGVVADRLGIPTATLRSWNRRYGIGPFDHWPGRHRLYTENDVAVLQRMQRLIGEGVSAGRAARVAVDAEVTRGGDTASLLDAAFALDVDTTGRLIDQSLRDRGVIDTWDGLLRPAFASLTTLQTEGGGCIDVEHLLSRATTRALQRLPTPRTLAAPRVLLACCDGDGHTLALEALSAALAQRGRTTVMLGASVPTDSTVAALHRLPDVKVVVLWAQVRSTANAEAVQTVAAVGVKVLVAGPGWAEAALPKGVLRLGTLRVAVERLVDVP